MLFPIRVASHSGQRLPGPFLTLATLLLLLAASASTAFLLASSWRPLVTSLDLLVLSLADTQRTVGLLCPGTRHGSASPTFCQ